MDLIINEKIIFSQKELELLKLNKIYNNFFVRNNININFNYYNDEKFFSDNNIKYFYISNSLPNHLNKRLIEKFKLVEYNKNIHNHIKNKCFFFGIYNNKDILEILSFKGQRYICFGGTDINYLNKTKTLQKMIFILTKILKNIRTHYICISNCIWNRFKELKLNGTLINFNLVNKNIFKPIPTKELGNSIYVYNNKHFDTKFDREEKYGDRIIFEVIKILPKFNFIFRSKIDYPYEFMPNIYKKCFIGLRLTNYDGNANTVQEFESCNIPIIHNQSEYGLKWKNIDDIINHIQYEHLKYLNNKYF